MNEITKKLYKYQGNNPFTDSQGRNFSDKKIQREFCPISKFWSLYNDHHEILMGTRGSGKTFLLKMMRRSMLQRIEHEKAKELVSEEQYIAYYVPMHMETMASLSADDIPEERKIILFKFIFNCLLACSIIEETNIWLEKIVGLSERYDKNILLTAQLYKAWFPNEKSESVFDLTDLDIKLRGIWIHFDFQKGDLDSIPIIFKRDLAAPLIMVQPILKRGILSVKDKEPTWIVCVDEAEFIPELFQRCINSFMRSNTNQIALKIATLPFYWTTLETLDKNSFVSAENDFNFQIVDMDYNGEDFKNLTNKLCAHRIKERVDAGLNIDTLEDFLGTVGNDKQIDYYRDIVGEKKASNEQVIADIQNSFSDIRKEGSKKYTFQEKTIHQKFAPILYVREVYKRSHEPGKGHYIPGWYAGADTIRKVSQGNPRLYIRLMSSLFSKATTNHFTTKIQHQVVEKFAREFCEASRALERNGEDVYRYLKETGEYLHKKVHGSVLITVGCSFKYRYSNEEEFNKWKKWIQCAVAFSKVTVSDGDMIDGITKDSVITFSYAYAANYWLPMRSDTSTIIPTDFKLRNDFPIKESTDLILKEEISGQLLLSTEE